MVTRTIRLRDGTVLRVAARQDGDAGDGARVLIGLDGAAGGVSAIEVHAGIAPWRATEPSVADRPAALAPMFRLLARPRRVRPESVRLDQAALDGTGPAPPDPYAEPFLLGPWPC